MSPGKALTLGFYPSCRGFGWAAFEAPFSIYDWGVVSVSKDKNQRSLYHFERILDRLEPETLVLEALLPNVRRTRRVVRLQKAIVATALYRGIDVAHLARGDVQASYADAGARTRSEIAAAVARQIPALGHRLPRKRGAWLPEDRWMAVFNAAALVMTHYRLDADRLFQDLSSVV